VRPPVMAISRLVEPSPTPSVGSSLVIDTILQTDGPQTALASATTAIGINWWFGGQITFGVAVTELIVGVVQ
jgi:hypothetical protein